MGDSMKILISLLIGLFSAGAFAQESTTSAGTTSTTIESAPSSEAPDANETKTLKKIEVTGSYIKRVDEEGPTPVQTISQDTLKKSGYNSVADVLRDAAVISTGGEARESSLSSNPGAATAGIGAFGSESVLVLLDGNRLPKIGGSNSVDLNLIPVGAIDHIEILKDGASATYGSDAIGGVMNFITKKDYNGGSVSFGQSSSEQGGADKTDFTGTFGKKFKNGSIEGIYQYKNNGHLADADRPFTKVVDLGLQGSSLTQQGSFTGTDGIKLTPNCPPEQQVPTSNGRVVCKFDYSKYSWNMPDMQQNSLMLGGTYRFSEYFNSHTQVTGTYRKVATRLAPAPGNLEVNPAAMNQYLTALGISTANVDQTNPTLVGFRLLEGGGTRDADDMTLGYTVAQTFDGKIAGSWTYNLTGAYALSHERQNERGYANTAALEDLINSGQYNVFAPAGQKGSLQGVLIDPWQMTQSTQSEVRLVSNGQLYQGGESFGPIAMAVGGSTDWQNFRAEADDLTVAGNTFGAAGGTGKGARSYQALFTEFSAFPVQSLEVDLAARYDKYSDFGNTFNPKLALSWQASDKVMFRTSVGTGFRAPNLDDLYAQDAIGYPAFSDVVRCANGDKDACVAQQYEVDTFANSHLKQETSIFYNAGILIQPKKNWNVETNFFVARIDDNVGGISGDAIMRGERAFGIQGMKDKFNIDIQRDPNSQELIRVVMPSAFNASFRNTSGFDFRVTQVSKTNIGSFPLDLVFDVDHIQYLREESQVFAGTDVIQGYDNNWKNTVSVTGTHNDHSLRVAARTISGGDKAANYNELGVVGDGSLRSHTEFDLNYTWDKIFKKATFNLGVKNVFNTTPPLDDTAQTLLNASVYDPIGRYFYTSIGYNF